MTPTSLLVSNDPYCSELVASVFAALGVHVTSVENFDSACHHLDGKHFDLVFVDCDDTYRGLEALKYAHQARANRSSVLVALLNGTTAQADAEDQGALTVLSKPLLRENIEMEIAALVRRCRGEMRGHRRVPADIPAYVSFANTFDRLIRITTVSEGGFGFRSAEPLSDDERLTLRFALPGSPEMRIWAELAWSDSEGMGGMKIVSIEPHDLESLRNWMVITSAAHA